jgi:neutral ceramidase
MNPRMRIAAACVLLSGLCGIGRCPVEAADDAAAWKAGAASVVITPEADMWMAGYAARNKPSEGKMQDLFAKALALQDAAGTRLVIVTTDLIGIPRPLRDSLESKLHEAYQLGPEAFLLNASHTHCGPELRVARAELAELPPERVAQSRAYMETLEKKLVDLVGQALNDLQPAKLGYSHARAGFAMNRRLPAGDTFRNSPYPDGPVDQSVPVLRVDDADGNLRAVLFGYACHNTTLGIYQFCGDYAGYAQEYLEEAHPGVTALFMMGCGGDQNPYPRRTVELAQQHGRALANAVEVALEVRPRPIAGPLKSVYDQAALQFAPPPSRDELQKMAQSSDRYDRRRGRALLEELDETGTIRDEYAYPIQVVQFGNDLMMVALAGEVVVDYSLRLKRELNGPVVWVAGYSNDVFGYVPSLRVLTEGGYEGGGAMRYTALPGPFAPSIEDRIVSKVHELVRQVRQD